MSSDLKLPDVSQEPASEARPRAGAIESAAQSAGLRIAYVLQNAGNPLTEQVGPAILIRHTVRGLERAGQDVTIFRLWGRQVARFDDLHDLEKKTWTRLGLTGTAAFKLFESGVRRFQVELGLPHLAVFDGFRFYEACRRFLPGFQLCHEYGGLFSTGAALACRRLGIPHILTIEADPFLENEVKGTPLKGLRGALARREAEMVYRSADRLLTVSMPAKEHFVQAWGIDPEKIVVMPNGVDGDQFHPNYDPEPVRQQLGLSAGPVVGFVGGFQRWHGVEGLVKAYQLVLDRVPDARLLLIGDGPARPAVEQLCRAEELSDRVTFTGLIPQVEIPALLAAVDVAVVPYPELPKELWFSPLKLYEYMAAGKATVASSAGQIKDVVEDGRTGLLVPPGDIRRLGEAIAHLLEHPEKRQQLGARARRQVLEHHTWDQYVQRLIRVYQSVLE